MSWDMAQHTKRLGGPPGRLTLVTTEVATDPQIVTGRLVVRPF